MTKRLFFISAMLLIAIMARATDTPDGPELKFDKPQHDYGTVYVDEMPETTMAIEFTNTGSRPLILSNVRACCGTRVTSWPREPISPGEKGEINIQFTLAPRPQRISRTVTVSSNSETNPTAIFRIVGQVVDRD